MKRFAALAIDLKTNNMNGNKFFTQVFATILFSVILSVAVFHYLEIEFLWEVAIVLTVTVLLSYFFSRRVSKPLEEIQKGAEKFARGDFSENVEGRGSREIVALAGSLNKMARELSRRIEKISLQKNEQEAMFLSMKEGVLAVNANEEIIRINKAARKFFQIVSSPAEVKHKHVYEVIRNKEMLDFIGEALNTPEHIEKEITVFGDKERVLLVNADPLFNAADEKIGTIFVMNNITKVKRLDKVRQEFVANVSHELKTPITSIKGYVETLLNTENIDEETSRRFLKIIEKNTNQMNSLIEDLLHLAKLDGNKTVELARFPVLTVIENALECCVDKIERKNISIEIVCSQNLYGMLNESLLERALANLIDNAVKYSEEGGKIKITAECFGEIIKISVRDYGSGIPKEHHARLFERFYRVDKGRSRDMGGTGLGLAIVKHVAFAHRGRVYVQSEPGKGSEFTIEIACAK